MKRMYLFLELQYDLAIWTVALSILTVNVSMPTRNTCQMSLCDSCRSPQRAPVGAISPLGRGAHEPEVVPQGQVELGGRGGPGQVHVHGEAGGPQSHEGGIREGVWNNLLQLVCIIINLI